jgi:hypothetical protein
MTRDASALVDGPRAYIIRRARLQDSPWDLTQEPLGSILRSCERLIFQMMELRRLIDDTHRLAERYRDLNGAYAAAVPKAWERWFAASGITPESIDAIASRQEYDAMSAWLDAGCADLMKWKREVTEWLRIEEAAAIPPADGPAFAHLEERYDLLLKTSRIDRVSLQRRTGKELRLALHRDLLQRSRARQRSDHDLVVRTAIQTAEIVTAAAFDVEEVWVYREAFLRLRRFGRAALTTA